MYRSTALFGAAFLMVFSAHAGNVKAQPRSATLAITMTNDATSNAIQVYDAGTHTLLQTLPTQGTGGVAGNARGIRQFGGEIVAVVNNRSNSVAVFRRHGGGLKFDKLVTTSSAPVSIDFGN